MQTWQIYLENCLQTYTDINFFPYFGMGNTLLKFVQAFKIHPVCASTCVCFLFSSIHASYTQI